MNVSDLNFELLLEKSLNFFAIKRDIETHINGILHGVKKVNIGVLNTITTASEKLLLKISEIDKQDFSEMDKMDLQEKFIYQTNHIIERLEQIRTVYVEHVFEKSILHKLLKHIDSLIFRLREANTTLKNTDRMKDLEDEINLDLAKNGEKGKISLGNAKNTKTIPRGLANDLQTRKLVVDRSK